MVAIILTILKIIGISILVILGIIVLLAALVLFMPVRYRAGGSYTANGIDISGRASWLIGIASVTILYRNDKPLSVKARLFGIPVFNNLKEHKRKKKNSYEKPELQAASAAKNTAAEEGIPKKGIANENIAEKSSRTHLSESEQAADEVEEDETGKKNIDKKSLFQKIRDIFLNFLNFFKNIKFTFYKVYVTIIKIRDNIKYYLGLLQQESTKLAFGVCKKQLLRILKNFCPKKYMVKLHLGFEDPAVMGDVLAVWGMLYPFHKGKIDIRPEFEQEIFEGSFKFKGSVSIYILVWTVWVFLNDKNIRQLRRQLNI